MNSKIFLSCLLATFCLFSLFHDPLYAEFSPFVSWGNLALELRVKGLEEKDPLTAGGTEASYTHSTETAPQCKIGFQLQNRYLKLYLLGLYEYAYIGNEDDPFSPPIQKPLPYPHSLKKETVGFVLGNEILAHEKISLGLHIEKNWSHIAWEKTVWEKFAHLEVTPWFSIQWTESQKTYFSLLLEQTLDKNDPQSSYKVQPDSPYPSFGLSHFFSLMRILDLAASYQHRKLIFEDFWYDRDEHEFALGSQITFFSAFTPYVRVAYTYLNYSYPWKRNGPCGQDLGKRDFNFYLRDALDCYREEKEYALRIGFQWNFFHGLSFETSYEQKNKQASEDEFSKFKQNLFLTLSWKTDSAPIFDSLVDFRPWKFKGQHL